jgi:lipoprotein-anchoring transpeptidase ErfK/SrfK
MRKPSLMLASFFLLTPLAHAAGAAQVPPPQAQPAPPPAAAPPAQMPAPVPQPPAPPAAPAPAGPAANPRSIGDVQVMLDRVAYSPGVIDAKGGTNTRRALAAFQTVNGLPATGKVDPATWQKLIALAGTNLAVVPYEITPADAAGPFLPIPEEMDAKAKLPALGYSSLLELLAERFHSTPELLQRLNPRAPFQAAGERILVPNARPVHYPDKTEKVVPPEGTEVFVSKSQSTLRVMQGDKLLYFAPVTSGSEHDPLPIGDWKVTGISRNPTFNYNPNLFWDAKPGDEKAKIPAGPNNPVGLVWIDLSKEHYGLHGTPEPKTIGKTTSHGCVRLTNWDAVTVSTLVKAGTPVHFTE